MRIKEGFIMRSVGEQDIVVAVGEASRAFNGIIRLNAAGAFLWKELQRGRTCEELTEALKKEYEVKEETARKDVEEFLSSLEKAGCILND